MCGSAEELLPCGVGGNVFDTPLMARHRALLVGVGLDQARVNGKPFPTYQTFGHAAAHDGFEDMAQDVALTNRPWRLREKVE